MQAQYEDIQRAKLADQLTGIRRSDGSWLMPSMAKRIEDHEALCGWCSTGRICPTGAALSYESESMTEALGWDAKAEELAHQEPLTPETRALYWFEDRSTSPETPTELSYRRPGWDRNASVGNGFELFEVSPERWSIEPETDEVNENWADYRIQRAPRQERETTSEYNWLSVIQHMGDTQATRQEFKARLRVWFPRETNPNATSHVAFYRTFLTVADDGQSALVYCAGCKQSRIITTSVTHVLATLRHALSHAPVEVQKGVEFFARADGETVSFELTGSTTTTEDDLSKSFANDARFWTEKAQAYTESHQTAQAAQAYWMAEQYTRAANA